MGTCVMVPVWSHSDSGSIPVGVGSDGFRVVEDL